MMKLKKSELVALVEERDARIAELEAKLEQQQLILNSVAKNEDLFKNRALKAETAVDCLVKENASLSLTLDYAMARLDVAREQFKSLKKAPVQSNGTPNKAKSGTKTNSKSKEYIKCPVCGEVRMTKENVDACKKYGVTVSCYHCNHNHIKTKMKIK